MLKVGSDFSGVGAFNQSLIRLGVKYKEVFACDMDKYARETFIHNYGEPEYYPTNVYEREIPKDSLDIYMTSPPCQAFSLAGKRLGKEDKRGILFFNSYEFIQVNKPRYFIFENVKGLLSDDNGKTFSEWVNLLGGKSVNGNSVIFPYEDSLPYHLHWQVLNAKKHGVPQNRERVFLIGIRDDADNNFRFPVEEHLGKRLKDVLENDVDEKYFLSKAAINKCIKSQANENMLNEEIPEKSRCIVAGYYKVPFDGQYLKINSATTKGYEDFWVADYRADEGLRIRKDNISPCMTSSMRDSKEWNEKAETRNPPLVGYNDKRLNETIEKNELPSGQVKAIDTYNKKIQDNAPTLTEPHHNTTRLWDGYKIRRLTPRECFRLMDFPDSFTWTVSDSQAYKQAGNSIVVNVLYKILKNLNLEKDE